MCVHFCHLKNNILTNNILEITFLRKFTLQFTIILTSNSIHKISIFIVWALLIFGI